MKICMISGTLPDLPCGVGDYTYLLCSELKRQNNHELIILTTKAPNIKAIEGVGIRQIVNEWKFSSAKVLLEELKKENPDLIHIQYPTQAYKAGLMINFLPMLIKRALKGVPIVATVHDAKTAHPFNKLRLIPFIFFADKIILTVTEEKEYLVKRFPSLWSKFEVIHLGSNIKVYELSNNDRRNERLGLGVRDEEILISHFGYMLQKKKIEIIFHALKRLIGKGLKVKLILISSFNPERDKYHAKLKDLVNKLNLNDYIIWTGYRAERDVSKDISSSDIGVQIYPDGVSFRRTSFIAPLMHGLPLITTKSGKLPEGLKDRENVLTFYPDDINGLASAMTELIEFPDLRERLKKNTKALLKQFSWENVAKEHLALYGRLIMGKRDNAI
ncbi:MAG: hypothetical protein COS99_02070 [Candidatus Omnitrophica bacterium CG07_land_8_20_14_0_80_42_15]|uniref:Glycosyltransferase subfamily 4-like N-terminal domain-containing protein n=1 Tax=Candidatus Aquitaenariimonas noxiae TaxID=1974741 RepID=A0A2J0L466_9BACT|nr:MAG: hypothetical protein COS99_02070 [Candidatus Omnitrophica bacterium CG07_land_8_20_14_0_80_42_15]